MKTMPTKPHTEPLYITTSSGLESMAKTLLTQPLVAVDTESNSLYAYKEQVCLIQFSIPEADYLVDTIALTDLEVLAPIFEAADIQKIFHAAEYDIICLRRDYGFCFNNVFDTMLAARILGHGELGLASILEKEFGVIQDKRFQKADWGKRPLTAEMLAYAVRDTQYLIQVRDLFQQELLDRGLLQLAVEDFNRISQCHASPTKPAEEAWRISGHQKLDPAQLAVLRRVWEYREDRARKANRPPFKVLPNSALMEIAEVLPQTDQELGQVTTLGGKLFQYHHTGLMEAIHKGLQDPYPTGRIEKKRPDARYLKNLEKLKDWRYTTAQKLKVESDVILPRDTLEKIAGMKEISPEHLRKTMQEIPWRYNRFANQIINLFQTTKDES